MTPREIYEERLVALQAGAFKYLDVEPVIPREDSPEGASGHAGGGTSSKANRIPIDHSWRDHERGYSPGEMTSRVWIEDVIEVLLAAPKGKLGQSVIVDHVCVLVDI